MNLFKNIRERIAGRQKAAAERYRELVWTINADDTSPGQTKEVEALMAELGLSLEQVEKDIQAVTTVKTLVPIAAEFKEREARFKAAASRYNEHQSLWPEIVRHFQSESAELEKAKGVAHRPLSEAAQAMTSIHELYRTIPIIQELVRDGRLTVPAQPNQ